MIKKSRCGFFSCVETGCHIDLKDKSRAGLNIRGAHPQALMIDYHVHTALCGHAEGKMEEYVLSAISNGLKEICFLDHLTTRPYDRKISMTVAEVPVYYKEARRLQEKYHSKIEVKAGLECDFDPERVSVIEDVVGSFSFDCIGASVHFIDDWNIVSRRKAARYGTQDLAELGKRYVASLLNMMSYDFFDVVCHIDVIKKFGHPELRSFLDSQEEIFVEIKKKGCAVEVNTSGYDHPVCEAYPSPAILFRLCENSVPITLGSDAHRPEDVGRYFARTIKMIRSAGYEYLLSFDKRKARIRNLA
jgi:histidinol-phosphatase (PHP family)